MKSYKNKTKNLIAVLSKTENSNNEMYYVKISNLVGHYLPRWVVEDSCDWEEIPDVPEYVKCIKQIGYCIVGGIFKTRPRENSFEWFYDSYNSANLPIFCDGGENNWDYSGVVIDNFFAPATKEEYDIRFIGKDYQILSFGKIPSLFTLRKNGEYIIQDKGLDWGGYSLSKLLNADGCCIHSVRRTSDGEIFTVGNSVNMGKILSFEINVGQFKTSKGKLFIKGTTTDSSPNCWTAQLEEIRHTKIPLFTTEDNVLIYHGDEYWRISTKDWNIIGSVKADYYTDASKGLGDKYNKKYFSTKQAAEEYLAKNKVLFVTKDGVKIKAGDPCVEVLSNFTTHFFEHWDSSCGFYGVPAQNTVIFSTMEDAQEYINNNKPVFTRNELNGLIRFKWGKEFVQIADVYKLLKGKTIDIK